MSVKIRKIAGKMDFPYESCTNWDIMRYVNVVVSYSFIVHVIRLKYENRKKCSHPHAQYYEVPWELFSMQI